MKRSLIAIAAALALPAAAMAQDSTPSPSTSAGQACKTERKADPAAFKQAYGTNKNKSNAFGKCVSQRTRSEKANRSDAASQCKAERTADEAAFTQKYGTGKKGRNAYGKCVSTTAKQLATAETEARVNAAKQCKAERKADPAAFKEQYGTNKNKANAFGKCVSKLAKAQQDKGEAETPKTGDSTPA
jgi:hypothetical protein